MRTIMALVAGILLGLVVAHVGFGPVDWPELGRRGGEVAADVSISAAVRAALALQKDFDLFGDVRVGTEDRVVTLSGSVTSPERRQLAELIARGVEGVEEVVNELQVRPDDQPAAPGDSTGR